MKAISKSTYTKFIKCPSLLWLYVNMPDLAVEDPNSQSRIEDGHVVGEWAKKYFPNTVDVTEDNGTGALDLTSMIDNTEDALKSGVQTIAEASFAIDGLFCSVDLLHKEEDGYSIYEVKSSTEVKDIHYHDVAFQKFVLSKCGLPIKHVYILHINRDYVRHGDIDPRGLLKAECLDEDPDFIAAFDKVDDNIVLIRDLLSSGEPKHLFCDECYTDSKRCPFYDRCHEGLPKPNVFDLKGLHGSRGVKLFNKGIVTIDDFATKVKKKNQFVLNQLECLKNGKKVIVHKDELKGFLDELRFPIYHLDFETMKEVIPPFDGAKPNQQVPTQYSLHIQYEDGHVEHKEFLGDSINPQRQIAESLRKNIPMGSCSMAYNSSFEKNVLENLASQFPDLSAHLLDIRDNIEDLEIPFAKGYYYDSGMEASSSIKKVQPALCQNDPELDYHALPLVHNGGEAMRIYKVMIDETDPAKKEEIRDGLLKYCCVDTLGMVKVLNVLFETVKS